MTQRRKPTKLQGIVVHAQGEGPEAENAQRMLAIRAAPVQDVSPLREQEMDVTAIVQRAEQALELALTVPEMKQVRDEAATLADYLKRRGFGEGTAAKAFRIMRLAEWRVGDELLRMRNEGELPTRQTIVREAGKASARARGNISPERTMLTTYASLGLDNHRAFEWQAIAKAVTYDRLSQELEHRVELGEPLTFASLQRKFLPPTPKGEQAEWEQDRDDFTEALQWAVNAGDSLARSMTRGRPLESDRSGPERWAKESDRLETAIRQQVAFLRKMQEFASE